jgi:hypothetical protein
MERVSIIGGSNRILFVAPHGGDDGKIASATTSLAQGLGSFAVVNQGWTLGRRVDAISGVADCNDIRHIHEDVVREEFLLPILRSISRIKKSLEESPLVVVLKSHCGVDTADFNDEEVLDMLLGCGANSPARQSCSTRTKNTLTRLLQNEGFSVYEGVEGSKFSARSKNNLNQLFKRWLKDPSVESVQLAIDQDLISDEEMISMTVDGLTSAFDALLADNGEEADLPEEAEV